jgi:L-ascorbate metabolism protein UlaG (beta-lactamase superfamily)
MRKKPTIAVMLFFGFIIFFLALTQLIGWHLSTPAYRGDVRPHFDGSKFINPGGVRTSGVVDLLKWMFNRERGAWEERMAIPYGPKPMTSVNGDGVRITFINHAAFLIQTSGINILTDPVWSDRVGPWGRFGPKRMRPPGIAFEDLPPIDIVLLSHNHYDHLDLPTLKRLARMHRPVIYCPLGVGAFLAQEGIPAAIEMDWWDERALSPELQLVSVPAQHFSGRGTFDRDASLWCGFVIRRSAGNIYFAGDSGYGDFFREIGARFSPVRVAMIPIGAYLPRWFMSPIHTSPDEALQIHLDVRAQRSIGMHYGTFPLADDGMDRPVEDLNQARRQRGIPADAFVLLEEGKGRNF